MEEKEEEEEEEEEKEEVEQKEMVECGLGLVVGGRLVMAVDWLLGLVVVVVVRGGVGGG